MPGLNKDFLKQMQGGLHRMGPAAAKGADQRYRCLNLTNTQLTVNELTLPVALDRLGMRRRSFEYQVTRGALFL